MDCCTAMPAIGDKQRSVPPSHRWCCKMQLGTSVTPKGPDLLIPHEEVSLDRYCRDWLVPSLGPNDFDSASQDVLVRGLSVSEDRYINL
jgi:hypothetical protein